MICRGNSERVAVIISTSKEEHTEMGRGWKLEILLPVCGGAGSPIFG